MSERPRQLETAADASDEVASDPASDGATSDREGGRESDGGAKRAKAEEADREDDSVEPPASGDAEARDSGEASASPPDSDAGAASDAAPESDADGAPPDIRVALFGRTDVGQIREHNEDNFLVADLTSKVRGIANEAKSVKIGRGGLLLAVCDGMGGAAAGEVASQLATDIIYQRMLDNAGHCDRDRLALDIVEALEVAGAKILAEANSNRACRGMGTTATVAALVDDYLLLGQVGDSRAYILRGDRLVQVTRDQSLVNQLIEAGQLTEEEAEHFEHSNIILQALGTADAVQVDLTFAELRRGDVLMMCSDGLSGMIRDDAIRETLTNVPDPVDACRVLIDDANEAGGHDNITVITAVFDGEGLTDPNEHDLETLKYAKYALPAWTDEPPIDAKKLPSKDALGYDDTPSIEITGEFEIDPDTSWDDLLNDRPDIPKEEGPNLSNVVIWVAVAVLVFTLYYLIAR